MFIPHGGLIFVFYNARYITIIAKDTEHCIMAEITKEGITVSGIITGCFTINDNGYRSTAILTYDDGTKYVCKYSLPELMDYDTVARLAAADLPHVVKIKRFISGSMTTEFVEGEDLSKATIPEGKMFDVIFQICDGISELHDLGIIHRDIKPANIILGLDGAVKIIDLENIRYTNGGKIVDPNYPGPQEYAALEMQLLLEVDHRADIYSLGATIDEIIKHDYDKYPIRDIIRKCMEVQPDDRYSSVKEVKEEIIKVAQMFNND